MSVQFRSKVLTMILWGLAICCLFLGSSVFAQQGPGSVVAEFLNVDPDARAGSMAGAYCAMAGGLSGFFYNPASLGTLPGLSAVLHHSNWYQSTFQEYAALGIPVGGSTALAASFGYIHYGSIAGYDADNNPTGDFSPANATITVATGRQFGDHVSFGFAGKYFQEDLGTGSFSGWAFDLGALYRNGPFALGLAAANLGPSVAIGNASYPLPRYFRVGVSYLIDGRLLTSTDVQLDAYGSGAVCQGAEYRLLPNLFVRAGYRHQSESDGNAGNPWTVGGGLLVAGAHFDYNYLPSGVLGDIHRLTVRFGK